MYKQIDIDVQDFVPGTSLQVKIQRKTVTKELLHTIELVRNADAIDKEEQLKQL